MADFNINIAAKPNIPYIPNNGKIRQGDCLTGITSLPIGIVETVNTPSIEFLFSEYTGANGWAELRISNLVYTHEDKFFVEYNSVALTPNVDPNVILATIDVTGVSANQAISTFFAKYNNTTLTQNASLSFDVEIEDTLGNSLGKVKYGVILLYVQCIPPAKKEKITVNSITDTDCLIRKVVTVKVPPEGSRYVYSTFTGAHTSISGGTLPATITSDTQYTMEINVSKVGGSTQFSTMFLFVKETSTSGTVIDSQKIERYHAGNVC